MAILDAGPVSVLGFSCRAMDTLHGSPFTAFACELSASFSAFRARLLSAACLRVILEKMDV